MSAADLMQSVKDARAAVDSGNWVDAFSITARLLGLPDLNGSNQFDADADFAVYLTSSKAPPKDITPLLYHTLVFRGMALVNDAKKRDKTADSESPAERAKKEKSRDSSTFNAYFSASHF